MIQEKRKNQLVIIGLGDLIVDFYFKEGEYIGAYGGGTTWNILSYLAYRNQLCYAIGSKGNDFSGNLALEQLHKVGIHTNFITTKDTLTTKRTFIEIPTQYSKSVPDVKTSYRCPHCKKSYWHSKSYLPKKLDPFFDQMEKIVLIFDNLKKENFTLIEAVKKDKIVFLDLGHKYNLRYLKKETILNYLSSVDVLHINKPILRYLLGILKMSINAFMIETNLNIIITTNARQGTCFYFRGSHSIKIKEVVKVPEIILDEVDSSGAGDAFFATFINCYLDSKLDFDAIEHSFFDSVFEQCQREVAKVVMKIGAKANLKDPFLKIEPCTNCKYISNLPERKEKNSMEQKYKKDYIHSTYRTNYLNLPKKLSFLIKNKAIPMEYINSASTILCVGSGASYITASFYHEWIEKKYHCFSSLLKPRDVGYLNIEKYTDIILFSYSGKSNDIKRIIDQRNREAKASRIILVTFQKEDVIRKVLELNETDVVISYYAKEIRKEAGFLSFFGVFAPLIMLETKGTVEDNVSWVIKRFDHWDHYYRTMLNSCNVAQLKQIDAFHGDISNVFAHALESMATESGAFRIQLHEKKDFSHGRFVLLDHKKPDLILFPCEEKLTKYENKLFHYLSLNYKNVIAIKTDQCAMGSLDLLIALYSFMNYISMKADVDLSNPVYNEEALKLYKYSGDIH